MEQVLGVQFGRRYESDGGGYVILEQAPYEPGVGYTTKLDLVEAVSNALYSTGGRSIECGLDPDDWSMKTHVYAYPSSNTLSFFTGVTHGSVGGGVHETITVKEVLSFRLSDRSTLRYPPLGISSRQWQGDVYDGDGKRVAPPALTLDGRSMFASAVVYGQVLLTYRTFRRNYRVTIIPREDSVENVYQSVFYAVWPGGVAMEKIDPPPGAEEDYANGSNCGWRTIVSTNGPDDKKKPPILDSEDKDFHVDYCTQERKD